MNILICDDDQYVRKMLEKIISKNKNICNIFTADDGLEAIKIVQKQTINIALLDIDMPSLNGIEAAKIISQLSQCTRFVFITAHVEYAIDSFYVHPYDYLLKPIDTKKLERTLNELIELNRKNLLDKKKIKDKVEKIAIKEGLEISFVNIDKILYFEKVDRKVLLHTPNQVYTLNKNLVELENILNNNFIRTHRSYIVNKDKIKKIKLVGDRAYQVMFIGSKKEAALSRNKYSEVLQTLSI